MNLYDKSSLILVPGAVKDGKVYSQRPENGDGDFTFSRASTATRVNENGLIESVSSNTPRLDYSGGASCPALLLEPQRTNLIKDSEYLSSGYQASVVNNSILSPEGVSNGCLFIENTSLNAHGIQFSNIIGLNANPVNYTISVFAKAKERTAIQLSIYADATTQSSSYFNISNGTTTGDSDTHKIQDYGNGWYRCSFTASVLNSTGGYNLARFMISNGSSAHYTGDGVSGLYMWGLQLEQDATYPTSYIPTYGTSQTRLKSFNNNNDIVDTPISFGANDNFTFFYEGQFKDFDGMIFGGGSPVGGDDYRNYLWVTAGTLRLRGFGEAQMGNASHSISKNTNTKILVKRNGSVITFFVDGVKLTTTNQANPNSAFTFRSFGWSYNHVSYTIYGSAKQFIIFPTALTDSECIALTTL